MRSLLLCLLIVSGQAHAQAFAPTSPSQQGGSDLELESLDVTGREGVQFHPQELLSTCATPTLGQVVFYAPAGRWYGCHHNGWFRFYTDGDGMLANPDEALAARTIHVQAPAGEVGIELINNAKLKYGTGNSAWMWFDAQNIVLNFGTSINIGNQVLQAGIFASAVNANWQAYSSTGGFQFYSTNNMQVSATATAGKFYVWGATGRGYLCDGAECLPLSRQKDWTGTLDFPELAAGECAALTFAATGAVEDEPVSCGGLANLEVGLVGQCGISANNLAEVRVCNLLSTPTNPPSSSFKVQVSR